MDQQYLYHLLVVDDDRRLRGLLEKYLSDHGFLITAVASAEAARIALGAEQVDLIVLDIMMPEESGLKFTQKLRQDTTKIYHSIPILMLTALSDPEQRIQGLETGADDYLTKPFEPKELLLRIQKILNRVQSSTQNAPAKFIIHLGKFIYNIEQKILLQNQIPVFLTSTEQKLMTFFASHPGIELSRAELASHIGIPLSPRTIDVQITRLRRKIEDDSKQPRYLRTIRHKGYVLYPDI